MALLRDARPRADAAKGVERHEGALSEVANGAAPPIVDAHLHQCRDDGAESRAGRQTTMMDRGRTCTAEHHPLTTAGSSGEPGRVLGQLGEAGGGPRRHSIGRMAAALGVNEKVLLLFY